MHINYVLLCSDDQVLIPEVVEHDGLLEQQEALLCDGMSVRGNLRANSDFWLNELKTSSFVKDIVLFGYRLPFLTIPVPVFRFNHPSVQDEAEFVSAEIDRLHHVLLSAMSVLQCAVHCWLCLIQEGKRGWSWI